VRIFQKLAVYVVCATVSKYDEEYGVLDVLFI